MKLLLVIGIPLIILLPTIILVSYLLKDIKDEDREEIEFAFNKLDVGFYLFINLLLFITGLFPLALIAFGVYTNNKTLTITGIIISPLTLWIVNLPLQINHILYERTQSISYNKKTNALIFIKNNKAITFDLNDSTIQLVHFDPPIKGRGDNAPGGAFGKFSLTNEGTTVFISCYLYSHQINKDINLTSIPNLKRVNKQFNFL